MGDPDEEILFSETLNNFYHMADSCRGGSLKDSEGKATQLRLELQHKLTESNHQVDSTRRIRKKEKNHKWFLLQYEFIIWMKKITYEVVFIQLGPIYLLFFLYHFFTSKTHEKLTEHTKYGVITITKHNNHITIAGGHCIQLLQYTCIHVYITAVYMYTAISDRKNYFNKLLCWSNFSYLL